MHKPPHQAHQAHQAQQAQHTSHQTTLYALSCVRTSEHSSAPLLRLLPSQAVWTLLQPTPCM